MSIGFFVEEDAAVVWRGPMLHKALTQFLQDVEWGELDYLLVDLPPGTGDVSMTLAQLLPQARFLIVTTPQPTAQKVARRAAQMAEKVSLEIAGVVENMSGFTTPSGERFQIFGEGGGQELADELDVPLLGKRAADDAAARAGRRGHAARDRGPGRRRRAGDPPARPRAVATRRRRSCPRCRSSRSPPAAPRRGAGNPWACRCRWPELQAGAARDMPVLRPAGPRVAPSRPPDAGTRHRGAAGTRGRRLTRTRRLKDRPSEMSTPGAAGDRGATGARGPLRGRRRRRRRRDDGAAVAEFDERRAKMERLRAEGIDPYPPVTLWDTRTTIADMLGRPRTPPSSSRGRTRTCATSSPGGSISRRGHGKTRVPRPARPVGLDPGRAARRHRSARRPTTAS